MADAGLAKQRNIRGRPIPWQSQHSKERTPEECTAVQGSQRCEVCGGGGILLTCTAAHGEHKNLPQYVCAYEMRLVCDGKIHWFLYFTASSTPS